MGSLSHNSDLAEELNSDFVKAVLPVTIFVGILACVGFLGNLLVLCVFSFKYRRCNFKYFVLCLALIDLTSCLTTIPGELVTQTFWYIYPVPEICKAKSFFNLFTVCASALCLLLIAIDRYIKVCKPFGRQIKSKMAIFLCLCVLVIAGIVSTPVPFYWGVQHDNVIYRNITVNVTSCATDQKYKNTEHPLIYSITTAVIIFIPMVVMAVLYFLIACEIRQNMHTILAKRPIAANSLDMNVTAPDASGKEIVNINNASKPNEERIGDERNYDSPETSTTLVNEDCTDRKDFPDQAQDKTLSNPAMKTAEVENAIENAPEKTLSNPAMKTAEVENAIENNDVDTLQPEKVVDSKLFKPKHIKTEENNREGSVSISSDDVHVNLNAGKRKVKLVRMNNDVKRKTLITFILSTVFFISTVLYLTLLSLIASEYNILGNLTTNQKAVYFFFFRLYFIHHVINPFVYAFLDSQFKSGLLKMIRGKRNIMS
ncbi:hypothetical protein ACJMK2_006321 [Sinanodonta woodiana]|uniref:G-protein coupled receptors family 1 profile domain-containing protein n=1 Tax=Sinanodonta woodiana TaxID=1069815 RepID=A0ABD3VSZ8_SINWO